MRYDTITYGAKNEAVHLGIDIPGEVSVVGLTPPESAQPVYDLSSIGYEERLIEGCVVAARALENPETG